MATHQSVLTSTWTFPPSSKVATTRQIDSTAHKLKPRSFYKSILWTSTLVWTMSDISKIIVNEAFIVTDGPISWLFVIAFVHSIYVFETFQYNLVCRNWSTTSRDISWIKFVTLLVYAILLLAYSKEPCIIFKVNIYKICYIMSSCSKTFYNILYVM